MHQETLNYSTEPKWVLRYKNIALPRLKGKAGLFAVELIGGGLRSRVLIKKGALKMIGRRTATGHQFTVVNKNNQICTSPGSGLYRLSLLWTFRGKR